MPESAEFLPGTLEMMALHVIGRRSLHGYAIARAIESASGSRLHVEEGSLYPALRRMERKGLVAGEWTETDTGRRAREYRLTEDGHQRLASARAKWERSAAAVHAVLGVQDGAIPC
ncbi:MAG: PadR family transcriptional regulator [Planctomycetota bacterium]